MISQKDNQIEALTQALGQRDEIIYSMNQRLDQMEGKIQEYFILK